MKILFFGESPVNQTGASRVNQHLLRTITENGHSVEMLGTNHFCGDEYDHAAWPFSITAVNGESKQASYEEARLCIRKKAKNFDLLFLSDDMHVPQILRECLELLPTIVLAAIDGEVHFPVQVDSLEKAFIPVVYSEHAYKQVVKVLPQLSDKLTCIQLGCEPDVFYPLTREERRAYRAKAFGISDDTFLVLWANRNQQRKDPARAMKAFQLFHERVPNSKLFMLTQRSDLGGDLVSQARLLGCDLSSIIFCGDDYNALEGYSREKLNCMYNAADVAISTSQGEGWGLTTTEAMAAGTPFIGPGNTTFYEILGHNGERGYTVTSGGPDLWSIYYGVDDAPRPLTSVTDMARALYTVYSMRESRELTSIRKNARLWTEAHTWEDFRAIWKGVLCRAEERLSQALQDRMAVI